KNRVLKSARSRVNKVTGNYLKGIVRGKYYKYRENDADSIRVYAKRPGANHAHLIEYGHKIVSKSGNDTGGYVPGHLVFKAAADSFDGDYERDCDKFTDKIIDKLT
ncbi:MAG: HK97 gp10 family phage protein, partial [Firmicutes bacterium]|nr:HK97 gp10 family phage protein [Bacillota bacterium]